MSNCASRWRRWVKTFGDNTDVHSTSPLFQICRHNATNRLKPYKSRVPVLRTIRNVWVDVAFLTTLRKREMMPQRWSPCQSRPLRRCGFFGWGYASTHFFRGFFWGYRWYPNWWVVVIYCWSKTWVIVRIRPKPACRLWFYASLYLPFE